MLRRLTGWLEQRKAPRTCDEAPEVTDVVRVLEPYTTEFAIDPVLGLWLHPAPPVAP